MANVLNNLIAVETVLFGIKFVKYDNWNQMETINMSITQFIDQFFDFKLHY